MARAGSWDAEGEDEGEGMLGLRRSLGWAVGLNQERIWGKGWWKDSGTERFRGCFELSYLKGVCKAGRGNGAGEEDISSGTGLGYGDTE